MPRQESAGLSAPCRQVALPVSSTLRAELMWPPHGRLLGAELGADQGESASRPNEQQKGAVLGSVDLLRLRPSHHWAHPVVSESVAHLVFSESLALALTAGRAMILHAYSSPVLFSVASLTTANPAASSTGLGLQVVHHLMQLALQVHIAACCA